jgi:hypothetical protein
MWSCFTVDRYIEIFRNLYNISMYLSFVMYLPEDGHMRCRNMQQLHGVYNTLSYTYVRLLVLISHLIKNQITHCSDSQHPPGHPVTPAVHSKNKRNALYTVKERVQLHPYYTLGLRGLC